MSAATTTRVRGLAAWQPQRKTIDLLAKVRAVLLEYADYLPLTVRQVFYRLVGAQGYDKTEHAYARLGEHMNRARRAGMIKFDAIRDDGITLATPRLEQCQRVSAHGNRHCRAIPARSAGRADR